MKKLYVLSAFVVIVLFQFCTSRKKMQATPVPTAKVTYGANVQHIMATSCSPCHMPPEGNKKAYNTYAAVKGDIDEIVSRVQRNPGEKGFMPMRHPKLPDSTIQVLVQWKNEGLAEK